MLSGKQVFWFLLPILIGFLIAYNFEQKFNAKFLASNSDKLRSQNNADVLVGDLTNETVRKRLIK
tara:strand:+ start:4319 stop:4513 length:195 start_codon:yes stop_codon:yes gene_type:complete